MRIAPLYVLWHAQARTWCMTSYRQHWCATQRDACARVRLLPRLHVNLSRACQRLLPRQDLWTDCHVSVHQHCSGGCSITCSCDSRVSAGLRVRLTPVCGSQPGELCAVRGQLRHHGVRERAELLAGPQPQHQGLPLTTTTATCLPPRQRGSLLHPPPGPPSMLSPP